MSRTDFCLESRYHPADAAQGGRMVLQLHNLSGAPLGPVQLAYTCVIFAHDPAQFAGARLEAAVASHHVLRPEFDNLAAGESWEITISGLDLPAMHLEDGPTGAYLIFPDGRLLDIETALLSRVPEEPDGSRRVWPAGQVEVPLGILPWPNAVDVTGYLTGVCAYGLTGGAAHPAARDVAAINGLAGRLFPGRMTPFRMGDSEGCLPLRIEADGTLPAEGYRLEFADGAATLAHGAGNGRRYGLTVLAQILSAADRAPDRFRQPGDGRIEDAPRFGWRGTHLDVSRRFYGLAEVTRLVDILAWMRMNRFHWHLTDDEGWRIEIDAYPELTDVGAMRGHGLPLAPQFTSGAAPHGGFYTKAEIRAFLAHAASLGIEVLPEVDTPGHATAILTALPHLRDPGEPAAAYHSVQGYANNALNPGVPETYAFLETLLGELADLFPGPFIHMGGDEVDGTAWLKSPAAQKLMADEGLSGTMELQAHFMRRAQEILRGLGKGFAGWNEVAEGGGISPDNALLIAWQAPEVIRGLADRGYQVVASPGQAYYMDMAQADGWDEPGSSWAGVSTPEHAYRFAPDGALSEAQMPQLLGVQGGIWGEHIASRSQFNHMVFPRLGAIAETGWTTPAAKDFERFAALSRLLPQL
ncbi:beta-N-acetylhexosaminidase [Oceanomicrobium pacificus]|uniref:beta-N-acetylhexosaminidase n=1 Tax=Oceanomicrobium pacificus TaxID=2692916 RepID=A0A6B0TZ78_9RHOB|nr:beta-N-acetylhexosaminidase [Oceanomicrobium pacificus]MXU66718.1 family 20 glycosylhydrolase [Oceanomicrobium pacificus]